VRAGHHKITATAPGYEPAVWDMEAVSGAGQAHAFELKRPAPVTVPSPASGVTRVERPTPTGVYIGLAATGVFAVGAGVMGALAMGKNSDFEDANKGDDVSNAQDLHDSVKSFNLVTDVLIGAAVVSAGVTTYLYFSRPKVDVPASGWLRVQPQVGLHSSTLQLEGAF
jgi:hypothetical protein